MKRMWKKLVAAATICIQLTTVCAVEDMPAELVRQPAHTVFVDAAAGGGAYVAVGEGGLVLCSRDLATWEQADIPLWVNAKDVVYNGSAFVIPVCGRVFVSRDGRVWEDIAADDTARLSVYGAVDDSGAFTAADRATGRAVVTQPNVTDAYGYSNLLRYELGGGTFFFGANFDAEAADDAYRLYRVEGADAVPVGGSFRNPQYMSYSGGQYTVYCVYVERPAYTGTERMTLEVLTSSDLEHWTSRTTEFTTTAPGRVVVTGASGRAALYYPGTDAAGSPVLCEMTAADGLEFADSGRSAPDDYRLSGARMSADGTVILLAGDTLYTARSGEAFGSYTCPTKNIAINARGSYADSTDIYWDGRTWRMSGGTYTSDDLISKHEVHTGSTLGSWMEGKALVVEWTGTDYLAYDRNFRRYNKEKQGEIYRIDEKWEQKQIYKTPGEVTALSYAGGICYIEVPAWVDEETGRWRHNLYWSTDLINWTEYGSPEAVPVSTGPDNPRAVLPLYTYRDYYPNGEQIVAEASLISFYEGKEDAPVRLESLRPRKVVRVKDYYYAVSQEGDGVDAEAALWLSRDGIYWMGVALPWQVNDIREVFCRGNKLVVQRGQSLNVLCVTFDAAQIFARVDAAVGNASAYVRLDGELLGFDTPPVIEDDRTLVPLRFLFEQMEAEVEWNGAARSATVRRGGQTVTFTLDKQTAYVNGMPKQMDVPARLVNQQTMVPLRFLSEVLGYSVEWDAASSTADISSVLPSVTPMPSATAGSTAPKPSVTPVSPAGGAASASPSPTVRE